MRHQSATIPNALAHPCDDCKAAPGRICICHTRRGAPRHEPHPSRMEHANA